MGMKEWAQLGAAKRVEEIARELDEIRRAFPRLASTSLRAGRRVSGGGSGGTLIPENGDTESKGKRRGRRAMSAAQRRDVSRRMKAYWASRRSAKK